VNEIVDFGIVDDIKFPKEFSLTDIFFSQTNYLSSLNIHFEMLLEGSNKNSAA